MTKVLLAVDGSALAVRAAQRAMAMFDPDAEVIALAVARLTSMAAADATGLAGANPVPAGVVEEANDRAEQAAREDAQDVLETLGRADGKGRALVERGEPGATICRVAAREGVDVVVVGSHGRGIVGRALMGSVSNHVLHHATCPVLVVRERPS